MIARIEPATERLFAEMATWRYEPPYDFYDGDAEPVLNPERFFEALDSTDALIGFLYFDYREGTLEYGLGLRPDLAGKGLGLAFFREGLEFGRRRYHPARVITNVAEFNERARKVYERAGFRETGRRVKRGVVFIDLEEMP